MQFILDNHLKTWEKKNQSRCCSKFEAGVLSSSKSNPMTRDRAKSLIEEWKPKVDLTILMAHGVVNKSGMTKLVFHAGIQANPRFIWGAGYAPSTIVPNELGSLPILSCNDRGLPDIINGTKIIKVGGNIYGDNYTASIGIFLGKYVKKECDACKKTK